MRTELSHLVAGLLLAYALAGCGGGGAGSTPVATPAPVTNPAPAAPPNVVALQGHFVGTVTIGTLKYFGNAVLTTDGAFRLYVGGLVGNSDLIQLTRPGTSAQFVATVAKAGSQFSGSGILIGQGCAAAVHSRFCDATAPAGISFGISKASNLNDILLGDIDVTTNAGSETWSLDLALWDIQGGSKAFPVKLLANMGLIVEQLAEFAVGTDTVMSIDSAGRLFFQSAHSGCVGNGTVTFNEIADVFDVALALSNCVAGYAYLNGEFEGLAITSAGSYWDDGNGLFIVWLSRPNGAPSPAALTMLGYFPSQGVAAWDY